MDDKYMEILKDDKNFGTACIYHELTKISASLQLIAAEMSETRKTNATALKDFLQSLYQHP